jgi:allophanate hydrolase
MDVTPAETDSMGVTDLLSAYGADAITPKEVVQRVYYRLGKADTNAWIATRDEAAVLDDAAALSSASTDDKPLYGVPFAVKDNIDHRELPTSAGCPAYTYRPETTATSVEQLIEAGALLIGKTNMDQFATGLVGTRSPYGVCRNVYNRVYISGGSSSGSAIAVARGHVPVALGTDTAGSGRIPAALNGLVGLKPTRGVISNDGVVPGCASLSCVSVLAETVDDAVRVERVAAGYDPDDPYSRLSAGVFDDSDINPESICVGIPAADQLEFFGDSESEQLFEDAIAGIEGLFGSVERIDFATFEEASDLLYNGPWVAERLTTVGDFIKDHPDDIDLTVRGIIRDGEMYSASDAFEAFHRLERLRKDAAAVFETIDALIVPTLGTIYTIEGEQLNPIEINSQLGYYTNFVNLIDLAAVSVPTGQYKQGPTFSVSVIGEAFDDARIVSIADEIHTAEFSF